MTPDDIQSAFLFMAWFILGGGFSAMFIVFGLHVGYCYLLDRQTQRHHYGVEFGKADLALAIVSTLGGLALLSAVIQALGAYSEVLGG